MQVLKRNGKREDVSFDKITARIKKLCYGLDANFVDSIEISKLIHLIEPVEMKNKNEIKPSL